MKEQAIRGAKKLCGNGSCFASFDCVHKNHVGSGVPLIQSETDVCPLAKYDVRPEKGSDKWYEQARRQAEPTSTELTALCSNCEFSKKEFTEETWLKEGCACLDCPVYLYREQITELAAEAAANI